jgi:hypothetical protein
MYLFFLSGQLLQDCARPIFFLCRLAKTTLTPPFADINLSTIARADFFTRMASVLPLKLPCSLPKLGYNHPITRVYLSAPLTLQAASSQI